LRVPPPFFFLRAEKTSSSPVATISRSFLLGLDEHRKAAMRMYRERSGSESVNVRLGSVLVVPVLVPGWARLDGVTKGG
jgi:hypothetical protein